MLPVSYDDFQDGILPKFRVGYQYDQVDLEDKTTVFDGPFVKIITTVDEPVFVDCSIQMNQEQSWAFEDFFQSVCGTFGGFFYKLLKTPTGFTNHLCRITSGIPTIRQIASARWEASFTIHITRQNVVDDFIPHGRGGGGSGEDELMYLPLYWFESDAKRHGGGLDALRIPQDYENGTAAYSGTDPFGLVDDNMITITRNFGASWMQNPTRRGLTNAFFPGNDGSFAALENSSIVASAVSGDGTKIYYALDKSELFIWDFNKRSKVTVTGLDVIAGADTDAEDIATMCVDAGGLTIFVGWKSGHGCMSFDGGLTFEQMPRYMNSGATAGASMTSSAMSNFIASTGYALVGFDTGHVAKLTKSTGLWTAVSLGLSDGLKGITSIAISSGNSVALIGTVEGYVTISAPLATSFAEIPRASVLDFPTKYSLPFLDITSVAITSDARVFVICYAFAYATVGSKNFTDTVFTFNEIRRGLTRSPSSETFGINHVSVSENNWFAARADGTVSQSSPLYRDPAGPRPSYPVPVPPSWLVKAPTDFELVTFTDTGRNAVEHAPFGNLCYLRFLGNSVAVLNTSTMEVRYISQVYRTNGGPVACDETGANAIFLRADNLSYPTSRLYDYESNSLETITPPGTDQFASSSFVCRMSNDGMKVVIPSSAFSATGNTIHISDEGGADGTWLTQTPYLNSGASSGTLTHVLMSGDGQKILARFSQSPGRFFSISIDGGITFNPVTIPGTVIPARILMSNDGNSIYLQINNGLLYRSDDNGATWVLKYTMVAPIPFSSVPTIECCSYEGSVIVALFNTTASSAVGVNRGLMVSEDFGATWEIRPYTWNQGLTNETFSVSSNSNKWVFFATNGQAIVGS